MPHAAPAHKSFADRASLYQEITDKINRARPTPGLSMAVEVQP